MIVMVMGRMVRISDEEGMTRNCHVITWFRMTKAESAACNSRNLRQDHDFVHHHHVCSSTSTVRSMGLETLSSIFRIDTDIPAACVREIFDVQDLYHNLAMPVQDWVRAAHDTSRGHIQHHSAIYKEQGS
jgi:hypothetical protein